MTNETARERVERELHRFRDWPDNASVPNTIAFGDLRELLRITEPSAGEGPKPWTETMGIDPAAELARKLDEAATPVSQPAKDDAVRTALITARRYVETFIEQRDGTMPEIVIAEADLNAIDEAIASRLPHPTVEGDAGQAFAKRLSTVVQVDSGRWSVIVRFKTGVDANAFDTALHSLAALASPEHVMQEK